MSDNNPEANEVESPHPKWGRVPRFCTSKVESARVLNLNDRSYFRLLRIKYPDAPAGRANASEANWEWLEFFEKHPETNSYRYGAGKSLDSKSDAETRRMIARAALDEHRLALAKGQVVPIDIVRRTVTHSAMKLTSRLFALPNSLAPQLAFLSDPDAIQKKLQEAIYGVIDDWKADDWHDYDFTCPKCGTTEKVKASEPAAT